MALWKKNIKKIDGPDGFLIPKKDPDTGEIIYTLPLNPNNSLFTKPIIKKDILEGQEQVPMYGQRVAHSPNYGALYNLRHLWEKYLQGGLDTDEIIHKKNYLQEPERIINKVYPFGQIPVNDKKILKNRVNGFLDNL